MWFFGKFSLEKYLISVEKLVITFNFQVMEKAREALTYRSVIVQIGRWSDSVTYWICTLMKRDVSAGQNARYIENFAMKECNHSFKIRNLLNFIFLALVDLKTKPQQGTCQQYM